MTSIELNEREATVVVTALGTKYNRLSQKARWLQKRITRLEQVLKENPDNKENIMNAINYSKNVIGYMNENCEELEAICKRVRSMYNIPYKSDAGMPTALDVG